MKEVYIPSIDAKDLYIANNYINKSDIGYNIRRSDGNLNFDKFINTADYSIDLMKLREVYKRVYRNNNFSINYYKKEYSKSIINVTFEYSNKLYNRIGGKHFIRFGHNIREIILKDCLCIINGELVGITLETDVENPASPDVIGPYFKYEDGQYKTAKAIPTLDTVAELRTELYENGFICDGVKYIRFKRSSGSSRVGKCLFIDEALYKAMNRWQMCGLYVRPGSGVDLAALESYIALTSSSIIDTINIRAENILVIDDYDSVFKDEVMAVSIKDGILHCDRSVIDIHNSIWDGQSLLDESMFEKYKGRSMLLLRNRFFKSACFNTKIQQFFEDYGITHVDQLNGFTLAKDITDIKMITTPNSIKFLKFGTLQEWLDRLEPAFGVVKYEKPTFFFDGRMVPTHYQLLNTLNLSFEETRQLLKPSLDYITAVKTDPAAMRYHLKYMADTLNFNAINSSNEMIMSLLAVNDQFCKTKIYDNFMKSTIKSLRRQIRTGHVLVRGNYSTLFGNPAEMLKQVIHKFDGTSELKGDEVHCNNFEFGKTLLSSRSPHITMGNILLSKNVDNEFIKNYFNLSKEIVCVNAINSNIQQRLNGCDYDSDTMLMTDDELLIKTARKHYDKFLVPTNMVESRKIKRKFTNAEKADLDIKTAVNKIGEVVNLSQDLNSLYWDFLHDGAEEQDLEEIYKDICILAVASGIEIDKAKKEFDVDIGAEVNRIKEKYRIKDENQKNIKPYFFKSLDQYKGYSTDKKAYIMHHTTMDYLAKIVNSYRTPRIKSDTPVNLSDILKRDDYDSRKVSYTQAKNIIEAVRRSDRSIKSIIITEIDAKQKWIIIDNIKKSTLRHLESMRSITPETVYWLIRASGQEEYKDISRMLMTYLFTAFRRDFAKAIKDSREEVYILKESADGDIKLYDFTFKHMKFD